VTELTESYGLSFTPKCQWSTGI